MVLLRSATRFDFGRIFNRTIPLAAFVLMDINGEIPSKGSWEHKVDAMEFVLPYIVLIRGYLKHKVANVTALWA
ncbi:hypothetical protein GUJ93_ZPchr0011g27194 [Zizania palustris]|uniref:Uncharacterized protein n=1 Tax=Zizania palustris TaxID=103762 RepID=A0A8J5WJU1_ZIZPA|nr:hypothetical protein GUJ93_ZPchr0011g27194 [Zizania palustris]